jgi:hypothetical protein
MNGKTDIESLNDQVIAGKIDWNAAHGGIVHILKYDAYRKDGIFGHFQFAGDHVPFCETLSHAYAIPGPSNTYTYQPIVGPGTYECRRGIHHIHAKHGLEEIETFEILGIADHGGLLFHPLNYQMQSEGCTGLGAARLRYDSNKDGKIDEQDDEMITRSRATFAQWMQRLRGVDSFMLQVL